jgi:hypothetical protein
MFLLSVHPRDCSKCHKARAVPSAPSHALSYSESRNAGGLKQRNGRTGKDDSHILFQIHLDVFFTRAQSEEKIRVQSSQRSGPDSFLILVSLGTPKRHAGSVKVSVTRFR